MRPSGSGKTSSLRAGICYMLHQARKKDPDREANCIYWPAAGSDPSSALAEILKESTGITCYGDPTALLRTNPGRLVIVIDQFERLRQHDLKHKPIFDLIRGVCRQPAPHALQMVIAFNVNYYSEWLDFLDEV